jgi:foldase protein PrsA
MLILASVSLFMMACASSTPVAPTQPAVIHVPTQPAAIAPTAAAQPIANVPTPVSLEANLATAWKSVKVVTGDKVASVNQVPISKAHYEQELRRQIKQITTQYQLNWNDSQIVSYMPQLQDSVLQQLIGTELVRQIAATEGVTITKERIESEIATLKNNVLSQGTFKSWEEFLDANGIAPEDLEPIFLEGLLVDAMMAKHGGSVEEDQVHAAHILVDTEEKGKEVLAKLAAGSAFTDLAKTYSIDTGSKDSGGELGWFPKGVMVPEFEDAAFALKVGENSQLVKTEFGYHIIRVLGHEMRPLEGEMLAERQQSAFNEWYNAQRQKATVEILLDLSSKQ